MDFIVFQCATTTHRDIGARFVFSCISVCLKPRFFFSDLTNCHREHARIYNSFGRGACVCVRSHSDLTEAHLSQRDRAMLRVIEYFAKSPKVTQDHSKWNSLEDRKSLSVFRCIICPFACDRCGPMLKRKEFCNIFRFHVKSAIYQRL